MTETNGRIAMNRTPLATQMESSAESLRKAAEALTAQADAIELAHSSRAANAERAELVAEAREAIERAKRNGSSWRIWQRVLDEFETGGTDQRGTENDAIRETMTFADDRLAAFGGPSYPPFGYYFHPRTEWEAMEALAAADMQWSAERKRDNHSHGIQLSCAHGYIRATMFLSRISEAAAMRIVHYLREQAKAESASLLVPTDSERGIDA